MRVNFDENGLTPNSCIVFQIGRFVCKTKKYQPDYAYAVQPVAYQRLNSLKPKLIVG